MIELKTCFIIKLLQRLHFITAIYNNMLYYLQQSFLRTKMPLKILHKIPPIDFIIFIIIALITLSHSLQSLVHPPLL